MLWVHGLSVYGLEFMFFSRFRVFPAFGGRGGGGTWDMLAEGHAGQEVKLDILCSDPPG